MLKYQMSLPTVHLHKLRYRGLHMHVVRVLLYTAGIYQYVDIIPEAC